MPSQNPFYLARANYRAYLNGRRHNTELAERLRGLLERDPNYLKDWERNLRAGAKEALDEFRQQQATLDETARQEAAKRLKDTIRDNIQKKSQEAQKIWKEWKQTIGTGWEEWGDKEAKEKLKGLDEKYGEHKEVDEQIKDNFKELFNLPKDPSPTATAPVTEATAEPKRDGNQYRLFKGKGEPIKDEGSVPLAESPNPSEAKAGKEGTTQGGGNIFDVLAPLMYLGADKVKKEAAKKAMQEMMEQGAKAAPKAGTSPALPMVPFVIPEAIKAMLSKKNEA